MDDNHGTFCWYELVTTGTGAAADFYRAVVGWEPKDAGGVGMDYTTFNPPGAPIGVGGMMALTPEMLAGGARPDWLGYIYVEDVDAAVAKVADLGGAVHRPATEIPTVGRFAIVADPQGAVFTLFKNAPMEVPPPAPPPPGTPGQPAWRELMAADWEEAFGFYEAMFGWTKNMTVDMGPMGVYQTFGVRGGADIGGMMTKPPVVPAPYWGYYFQVDGAGAAIERVKAAGGQIIHGPTEVPGGQWVVQAIDPQGAMVGLVSNTP